MAAPNVQVLNRQLAAIEGFLIDCLLSDNHTFDSDVTEFPVESGATVSDNIRNKPLIITMECLISNTPIGQLATLRDRVSDPSDTAYELMLKIRADRLPVTIRTSLRTYEHMALQSLTIPRESGRGDELKFTAVFKQIELVVNRREKRVAIAGAKAGPTNRNVLTPIDGEGYLYVDIVGGSWFDNLIDGWRKSTNFSSAIVFGNAIARGFVVLRDQAPDLIGTKVFNNEPFGEHTVAKLKARLRVLNGGSRLGPSFKGRDARRIMFLPPSQYKLFRDRVV